MPRLIPAQDLTTQIDIDFWGAWFFHANLSQELSEADVLDQEYAFYMGGEL